MKRITILFLTIVAIEGVAQTTSPNPDLNASVSKFRLNSLNLSKNNETLITFSEFPINRAISDQYKNKGIVFGGSGPFITVDGANPTSPVLSGTPRFEGNISGNFIDPESSQPTVVESFSFDAGYFDNYGSTRIQWFDPQGKILGQRINSKLGIESLTFEGGNIASWRIETVANEPAGFAIDNFSHVPAGPSILFREIMDSAKEGTWGVKGDEIPGYDHTAFQFENKVYESHPGYAPGTYLSKDGKEKVNIASKNGVQVQHSKATFEHDSMNSVSKVLAFESIPISKDLASKMKEAINSKFGSSFQLINYTTFEGLAQTLVPAVQKGGGNSFTCVGLVEWAAEHSNYLKGEGFIPNKFESFKITKNGKKVEIPLLSPQLLNYAMKTRNLLNNSVQWFQGLIDPVNFVIRDPIGRKLGYLPSIGKVNEMPNAFYSGTGKIQQFLIPNALPGEYTITMQGLDAPVFAAYEDSNNAKQFEKYLNKNQIVVEQIHIQPKVGGIGDLNNDSIINNKDINILKTRLNKFTDTLNDPGDINGDGLLSNEDVNLLTRLVKTLSSGQADVNQDGIVDCNDFTIIKRHLWKEINQEGFNPEYDLVSDGIINIRDLALVSKNLKSGLVCK